MLDAPLRRIIDPPLEALGRRLARLGIDADALTLAGFGCGLLAAGAIALGEFGLGFLGIVLSRLADALDGPVARATSGPTGTDRGGLLDIVLDFTFYGAVPLGFVLADPATNALAGAVLLFAFYANGASFLAFAVMAARRSLETTKRGAKSLYFTGGLAEGTETIAVFLAMCLWPAAFPLLAYAFAAVCALTTGSRVLLAWQVFR